ncbi:hypothetical protein F5Y16DRAFT_403571 [Xylariaceae sp. FL0255]|nr:hypothetical protein F5Y16DRAFT_403571 [Xylariaceae sp. FL0255]
MKSIYIYTSVAGAALISAQAPSTGYFPGQPTCALPCLSSAIPEAGCSLSDIGCLCGPTQSAVESMAESCLLFNCNPIELGQAISAGDAVCSSFSAGELSFTKPSDTPMTNFNPGGPMIPATTNDAHLADITAAPSTTGTDDTATSGSGTSMSMDMSMSMGDSMSGMDMSDTTTGSSSTNATATETLIGPSATKTGSLSLKPSSTAAAATQAPARVGAGIMAGLLGAAAFLY